MKNQRATLVLLALFLVCASCVFLAISWYRSGSVPPGPDSFFQPPEVERAVERLEAFRLDMAPAIRMCRDIMNHVEGARDVSFTNLDEADRRIRGLAADLAALEEEHAPLVAELERRSRKDGAWEPPFRAFVDQSSTAYADALDFCRVLRRTDWEQADLRTIEEAIIRTKDLAARLRDSPMWNQREELRRRVYPELETAYRHRNESSPDVLMPLILRPAPPLVHWLYARLLEAHSPLPAALCAAELRRHAEAVSAFRADLTEADARGILAAWAFPSKRPDRAALLASILDPLERSDTIPDWQKALAAQEPTRRALIEATQAAAEHPDPEVKLAVAELEALGRKTDVSVRTLLATRTVDSIEGFVESVRQYEASHARFAPCDMRAFSAAAEAGASVMQAMADLLGEPGLEPELAAARFKELRDDAETLGQAAGADLAMDVTRDALNRWCWERWPPAEAGPAAAPAAADLFRRLHRDGTLPDPVLLDAARLLDEISVADGFAGAADSVRRWRGALTPEVEAAYPDLVRRIQGSILDLELGAARDELVAWIASGQDGRLRGAAERIFDQPPRAGWESLRKSAAEILRIIELPQRLDSLDLSSLDNLQAANADWIPPAPEQAAPEYVLYKARVEPLLEYAAAIQRIADPVVAGDPLYDRCAEEFLTAWAHRKALSRLYERWEALDRRLIETFVHMPQSCLPLAPAMLFELADALDEMATWGGLAPSEVHRIGLHAEAAHALANVLRADPSSPGYAIQLDQASQAVEIAAGMRPALTEWFAQQAAIGAFAEQLEDVPNSYMRIRREVEQFTSRFAPTRAEESPSQGAVRAALSAYERGLEAVAPLTERDRSLPRDQETTLDDVITLATDYMQAAVDPRMPKRLAQYARDQSTCLRSYAGGVEYTFRPAFSAAARSHELGIPYRLIDTNLTTFGYGTLREGRGSNLEAWVRTSGAPQTMFTADWRDDPETRRLILSDIQVGSATVSWTWGTPLEFGIRVAHTQDPNRDVVPDGGSGRSRWNPFDYGAYRVEPHEYLLAAYASPEMLIRAHPDPLNTNLLPRCSLDDVLDPDRDLDVPPVLLAHIDGMAPGRDLDWPKRVEEMDSGGARRLRQDVEAVLSNLVDEALSIGDE